MRHLRRLPGLGSCLALVACTGSLVVAATAPENPNALLAARDIDGLRSLLTVKDAGVLASAADALRRLALEGTDPAKLTDCLDPLAEVLTNPEPQVRLRALAAMGRIVARLDRRAEERWFLGQVEPLLRDPVALVRRTAVSWTTYFKELAARREAIRSAADEKLAQAQNQDLQSRVQAAVSAIRVAQQQHDRRLLRKGLSALSDALKDADPAVQSFGTLALVQVAKEVTNPSLMEPLVPSLTATLHHANSALRRYAALTLSRAFERITSEEVIERAVPSLLQALSDRDAETRQYAARALDYGARQLSDQTVLHAVILALTAVVTSPRRSSGERRYAARGLASAGQNLTDLAEVDVVIQLLLKVKNDADSTVRDYADELFDALVQHRGDLVAGE